MTFQKNFLVLFLFSIISIHGVANADTPEPTASPGATKSTTEDAYNLLARLPIQNGGRIKPLDSFARDAILFIAEKRNLEDNGTSTAALATVLDWLHHGEQWSQKEFIVINHIEGKKLLGLDSTHKMFSPVQIAQAPQIQQVMETLTRKQRSGTKLNATEQAVSRAISKLEQFQAIATGNAWTIVPTASQWKPLNDESIADTGIPQTLGSFLHAKEAGQDLSQQVQDLASRQAVVYMNAQKTVKTSEQSAAGPLSLLELAKNMNREVQFNRLRPFQKSWILYLLAFLSFLLSFSPKGARLATWCGWILFATGFVMHTYGFALRCLLTGHPPVTNMYESTIWVPWGVILFSGLISLMYRHNPKVKMIPLAAAAVAVLSLILSDNVPAILDPTIKPLEPVLRSNYWLTIHVLTITLSYAAFALSLGLGNVVLGLFWRKPQAQESITLYSQFMYRAVQFGVVLLAAGTILGGVWADYSWGRFWGWDPKETWALIALLMYIAVLHGKWAGWLRQFGLVIGTVICFLGVLMAWYGVNFVLGVGLHSYGFSSGGLSSVLIFIALQITFVAAVVVKVTMRNRQLQPLPQ